MTRAAELVERLRGYNPPDRTIDEQRQIAQDISEAADTIELLAAAPPRDQDGERWRKLMELGTCYHDYKAGEERFIWSGSKRVYFHECDETSEITLTEYIDAALGVGAKGQPPTAWDLANEGRPSVVANQTTPDAHQHNAGEESELHRAAGAAWAEATVYSGEQQSAATPSDVHEATPVDDRKAGGGPAADPKHHG